MAVKLQSSKIPQNPGVYFFHNAKGKILYIGKATNLRARLSSYFRPLGNPVSKSLKTASLLKEASKVDWQILNSEVEALIKEAGLIKKYRPKYNVLMRDDKQYFYVGFTKELFQKVFITHQPRREAAGAPTESVGADFIGPFTEGGALRSVLKTLRRPFPYCTCKNPHKQPCLNAKLGKCLEFCCLKDSSKLTQSFDSFSSRQRGTPRVAWPFRSSPRSETMPKSPQNPPKNSLVYSSVYNKNISAIKKILSGKNQTLTRELKKDMQKFSKAQKYEKAGRTRDQMRALERIFEHRGVIRQDLPSENAKAIHSLESILGAENINRIEAYDIANIGGKFAYGSMAVLSAIGGSALGGEDFILKKEDYRIFKIKNLTGSSNDPLMIKEILMRKMNHPEWPFPQVIIVDGGKPQMSAAAQAIRNNSPTKRDNISFGPPSLTLREGVGGRVTDQIKILALTKNKKHVGDHIFIQGQANPMPLGRLPPPLKNLILHLDAEAHRFAIKYYRNLHRKNIF